MIQNIPERPRIYSLDLLRGLLAVAVMVYHLLHYEEIVTMYAIGRYAVYSFFVLSGFSMYYVYRDKLLCLQDLKNYFIKRFFRIAPLLYIVIIGVVILRAAFQLQVFDLEFWERLVLNYTLLYGFVDPGRTAIAPASWSLGVEWVFYCLFPIAMIFTQGCVRRLGILCAVLYAVHILFVQTTLSPDAHLSTQWADYIQPVNFFAYFAFGMMIAECRLLYANNNLFKIIAKLMIIPAAAIFFIIPQSDSIGILKGWASFVMFFAAIGLVYGSAFIDISSYLLQKISQYLGNISYAVYLFHVPVYWVVSWFHMGTSITITLTVILTLIGATLSYHIWERPFQNVARHLIQKGKTE